MAHVRLQPGEMWRAQGITITRDVDGELLTLERNGCIVVIAASEDVLRGSIDALFANAMTKQKEGEVRDGV